MSTSRVTMQHIMPSSGLFPIPQVDAQPDWSGPLAPPSILLDYVYGVAAIKRWAANDVHQMLYERHKAAFSNIPRPPRSPATSYEDDIESDDVADKPPGGGHRYGIHHKSKESGLCQAVDLALAFSLYIRGYPPGTTWRTILEKQDEEAVLRSRQVGREAVQRWLETMEVQDK